MEISVTLKKFDVSLTYSHVAFDRSRVRFQCFYKRRETSFFLHNTCKMKHQEFPEECLRNVELDKRDKAPDRKT